MRPSRIRGAGRGLFARFPLPALCVIGPVRPGLGYPPFYLIRLTYGRGHVLCGGATMMANHSRIPNAAFVMLQYPQYSGRCFLTLVSIRPIEAREEIFVDYGQFFDTSAFDDV